jgi:cytochrome b561
MVLLRDNESAYGYVTIAIHWIAAALTLYLFWSGYHMMVMARGAARAAAELDHVAFGWGICVVVLVRLVWRAMNPLPELADGPAWQRRAARLVHWLLLGGLLAVAVTGYMVASNETRLATVWGLFAAPKIFGEGRDVHRWAEEIHGWVSHGTAVLVVLHVLAALKHAVIDRDGTLRRMIVAKSGPG